MTLNKDQQKLEIWLSAYALQRQLDEDIPEIAENSDVPDFSTEAPPAEGQIRLWPVRQLHYPPMYGLLMSAGYARWRVFPFSPFLTPAVPQEFLLKTEGPARVLEGWNARELGVRQAAASWLVEQVADEKLFLVNRWWLMLASGEVDAEAFGELQGPPLRHPLDPRHDYLEAEACRADWSLAESPAVYDAGAWMDVAAEPEGDYGKKSENDDGE
jgi:hypothetical protein